MNRIATRLSLILTALSPVLLGAQAAPPAPDYNVLTVYRETVKPGKGVAHNAHEEAWARAVAGAKPPNAFLAMTAMSGAQESWYMSAFPNWAAYEAANKAETPALAAIGTQYSAKEDEYLSDGRGMVLTFRADLSYGPPADLPASRYFSVTRISVRPGQTDAFEENRRIVKAAHEKAGLADSYSMWQTASGAPAGTYFIFVARKALSEIDGGAAIHSAAAYQAALGGPEGQKKMAANTSAAVISSQTDLFAFAPQQSVPPPEWVAADPTYWKHKVPVKKTP